MATKFDGRRWQMIAEWTAEHRVPQVLARCTERIAPLTTHAPTGELLDLACKRACEVLLEAMREGLIEAWEAPRVTWLLKGEKMVLCFSRTEVPIHRLITGPGGRA